MVGLRLFMRMSPDTAMSAPMIGAGVAATVLAVASAATWLPARRAATVNPAESLRVD
jgi:ABC-type lipoprotein release transport system permease subunit